MAGHSKWSNIRYRKSAQDAKKGKSFTRLIREIMVAARAGGEDPNTNPRLRTSIDKALDQNMPKDTVRRAIQRAVSGGPGEMVESIRYEGYAAGGIAVLVEALTDNRNRAASAVRSTFTKHGGQLGVTGSVSYLFQEVGCIVLEGKLSEEEQLEILEVDGVQDYEVSPESTPAGSAVTFVFSEPSRLDAVARTLKERGWPLKETEMSWVPKARCEADPEAKEKLYRLVERLEELEDVQDVFHNLEEEEADART